MDQKLKTALKIAAAIALPGAGIWFCLKWLSKELDRQDFKAYVRKTYGQGSKYEYDHADRD